MAATLKIVGVEEMLPKMLRIAEEAQSQGHRANVDQKRQRRSSRSRRRRTESKSKATLSCSRTSIARAPSSGERTIHTTDTRPQTAPPPTPTNESSRRSAVAVAQRLVRSRGSTPPPAAPTPIDRNRSDGDRDCREMFLEKGFMERREGSGNAQRKITVENESENPVTNERPCGLQAVGQQPRSVQSKENEGRFSGGLAGIMGRHFNNLIMAGKRVLSGNRSRQQNTVEEARRRATAAAANITDSKTAKSDVNARQCVQREDRNVRLSPPQIPSKAATNVVGKAVSMDCTTENRRTLQRDYEPHGDSGQGDAVKQTVRRGVSGPVSFPSRAAAYQSNTGERKQTVQTVRPIVNRNVSTPVVRRILTLSPQDEDKYQKAHGDGRSSVWSDNASRFSDVLSEDSTSVTTTEGESAAIGKEFWCSEGGGGGWESTANRVDLARGDEMFEATKEECDAAVSEEGGSEESGGSRRSVDVEEEVVVNVDLPDEEGGSSGGEQIEDDNDPKEVPVSSYKQMRSSPPQGQPMSNVKVQSSGNSSERSASPNGQTHKTANEDLMEYTSNAELFTTTNAAHRHSSEANVQSLKSTIPKIAGKASVRNGFEPRDRVIHAARSHQVDQGVDTRKLDDSSKQVKMSAVESNALVPTSRRVSRKILDDYNKKNGVSIRSQKTQDDRCNHCECCTRSSENAVGHDQSNEFDGLDRGGKLFYDDVKEETKGVNEYCEKWLDLVEKRRSQCDRDSNTSRNSKKIGGDSPVEIEKAPVAKRLRDCPSECIFRPVDQTPSEKEKMVTASCHRKCPEVLARDLSTRYQSDSFLPEDRWKRVVASGKVMKLFHHPNPFVDSPLAQSSSVTMSDSFDETKTDCIYPVGRNMKAQYINTTENDVVQSRVSSSDHSSDEKIVPRPSATVATQYSEYESPAAFKCEANTEMERGTTLKEKIEINRSPKEMDLRKKFSFSSASDVLQEPSEDGEDEESRKIEGSANREEVLREKGIERKTPESTWRHRSVSTSTVETSSSQPMTDATVLEREGFASKRNKEKTRTKTTVRSRGSSDAGNGSVVSEVSAGTSHGSIIPEDLEFDYDPASNTIQKRILLTTPDTETTEYPSESSGSRKCQCDSRDAGFLVRRLRGVGRGGPGGAGVTTTEAEDETSGSYYTAPPFSPSSSDAGDQCPCAGDAAAAAKALLWRRRPLQRCPILWEKEVSAMGGERDGCGDNLPEVSLSRKTTKDSSCGPCSDYDVMAAGGGKRDRGCGPDSDHVDGEEAAAAGRKRRIVRPSRVPRKGSAAMERLVAAMAAAPASPRKKVVLVCCQTSTHGLQERNRSPQSGRTKWRKEDVDKTKEFIEKPVSVGRVWLSPLGLLENERDQRIRSQQIYATQLYPPPGRNVSFAAEVEEVLVSESSPMLGHEGGGIGFLKGSCDDINCPFPCSGPRILEEDSASQRSDLTRWVPAGFNEEDESIEELLAPQESTIETDGSGDSADALGDQGTDDGPMGQSRLLRTVSPEPTDVSSEEEAECPHSSKCTIQLLPRCHCREAFLECHASRTTEEELFIAEQTLDRRSLATQSSEQEFEESVKPLSAALHPTIPEEVEKRASHTVGAGGEAVAPRRCYSKPFRYVKLRTCAGEMKGGADVVATTTTCCECQTGGLCSCCLCVDGGMPPMPRIPPKCPASIPLICNASGRQMVVGYIRLPLHGCTLLKNPLPAAQSRVDETPFAECADIPRYRCSQTGSKMAAADVDVTRSLTPEGMASFVRGGAARQRPSCARSKVAVSAAPSGVERRREAIGEGDNVVGFASSGASANGSAANSSISERVRRTTTVRVGRPGCAHGKRTSSSVCTVPGLRREDGSCGRRSCDGDNVCGGEVGGDGGWDGVVATSPVVAVRGGGGGGGSTSPSRWMDDLTESSSIGCGSSLRNLPRHLVLGEGERPGPNNAVLRDFDKTSELRQTTGKQGAQKSTKRMAVGKDKPLKKTMCNTSCGNEAPGREKEGAVRSCTITKSAAIFNFTECDTTFLQHIRCDDAEAIGLIE